MKPELSVCVLIVLVCYIALCVGNPLLLGGCKLEDVSENLRNECVQLDCKKQQDGTVRVLAVRCGEERCFDTAGTLIKGNQSKIYPDCCDSLMCAS